MASHAVASHAVVDRAIGAIVGPGRMTPEGGRTVLKEVSPHTDIELRDVAEPILLRGRGGRMPDGIRAEPEDAVDRHGPTRTPGAPPPERRPPE